MGFGDRLEWIINELNISKKDFALDCGISKNQIFNYLKEKQEPTAKFFRNLKRKYTNINLDWLISGSGEPFCGDENKAQSAYYANGALIVTQHSRTQEFIFNTISGGGFVATEKLPVHTGVLDDFIIVPIEAKKETDISVFEIAIIATLGEKPVRGLEMRARQCMGLITSVRKKNKFLIVVISNAHLISPETLYLTKLMGERGGAQKHTYRNGFGFVLLGNLNQINMLLNKVESVKRRTTLIEEENTDLST